MSGCIPCLFRKSAGVCRGVAVGAIDAWGKHIFWENAALWIIEATEDYIWIRFISVQWIHLLQKTLITSKGCMFVNWYYFPPDAVLAAAGASRWLGHGNGGPLSTLFYIHVNALFFILLYTMCGRQKNTGGTLYIYIYIYQTLTDVSKPDLNPNTIITFLSEPGPDRFGMGIHDLIVCELQALCMVLLNLLTELRSYSVSCV